MPPVICARPSSPSILGDMHLYSLSWNDALVDEDIYQALKWFYILLGQKVVVHGYRHEMDEAAVQL